jgi:hypothetical protein
MVLRNGDDSMSNKRGTAGRATSLMKPTVDDSLSIFEIGVPFHHLNDISCHGAQSTHQTLVVAPSKPVEYHVGDVAELGFDV